MFDHDQVTAVVTANRTVPYGVGIKPNPYSDRQPEWLRRHQNARLIEDLDNKIKAIFEPRFITPPETSETIAALVTMTDARNILELGTCTGFSALHILKAIVGKTGAHLTCMDNRPAHDRTFFSHPMLKPYFAFIEEKTPEGLGLLANQCFDFVFVDSDHSVEHCEKELEALWPITREGTVILFHDCPEQQTPDSQGKGVIWTWLHRQLYEGRLRGTCFPSCRQMDCEIEWGPNYPIKCSPGLGIFIRR